MSHSLRAKLSGLHYKGILEDKDYKRLCHALDLEKEEQVKKNCDTCTYSDEKDSGECYECVKGIQDWYEKSWECKGLYADGVDYSRGEEKVSIGVYKQIMKERDIAIDQLKELGYEFGQKIEPCEDAAISRKAVLEYLKANSDDFPDYHEAIEKVVAMPSVQPSRKGKGHWIEIDSDDPCWYMCSKCHRQSDIKENYCPNCGARMVEHRKGANKNG